MPEAFAACRAKPAFPAADPDRPPRYQRSDMHDRPASILPISVVSTGTTW